VKTFFCTISALAVASGALYAQTPPEPPRKPIPLSELVVSVTRTDRTVREVPVNVTVLTREQIRLSGSQTVPDLLRSIPGFTMRDYQGTVAVSPARQAPGMRGLGGTSASRTLVLVDGVPLDDPFTSWVYWARIPLDLVERIEVVRGGSAGIWGNRALGGVVNIITQRPTGPAARLSLQGGEWGTGRANGMLRHRSDKLGIAFAGELFNTDGYYVVPALDRGPIDIPAGTRHQMAFGRLEYQATPTLALHFSGNWFDEYRRNATHFKRVDTEIAQVQGGVTLSTPDGSRWSLNGFGARKRGSIKSSSEADDRQTETPLIDQFANPANSAGASLQWSHGWGTLFDVSAGADLFWTDGAVNEDARWVNNAYTRLRVNAGSQLYRGLYLQNVLTPSARLSIVSAARLDFWRNYQGVRTESDIQSGSMLVDTAYTPESDSHISYNLGVHYDMTDRLSWRSSVYTAFRAPTLNELYKSGRESGNITIEANPQLEAESLLGAELGADYILGSKGVARLTAFWSRLTDPIVDVTIGVASGGTRSIPPCGTTTAGGTCRQRQNLGRSRTYGVEAELEFQPAASWRLRGTYTWNPTKVMEAPGQPQILGKVARAVARNTFTARADYANPRVVDVALTSRWVGRRFDDDINTLELEPFFVLDAGLSRAVGRHWEVFGGSENILGREYAISKAANGKVRVGAPRLLLAGVRARW
jgi:outer membrane receptor protein involved in Fe transport